VIQRSTDDDKASRTGQHLRLTVETDDQQVNLLHARVIREPLIPATRVIGPLVYQVFLERRLIWIDTVPDPLIERGFSRPKEREHFFHKLEKGTFVIQIPLSKNQLRKGLQIKIFRATTQIPEMIDQLANFLQAQTAERFKLLGIIDLPLLMRHPDWKRILTDGAFSVEQGQDDTKG
jgi:hypothetical protein